MEADPLQLDHFLLAAAESPGVAFVLFNGAALLLSL